LALTAGALLVTAGEILQLEKSHGLAIVTGIAIICAPAYLVGWKRTRTPNVAEQESDGTVEERDA